MPRNVQIRNLSDSTYDVLRQRAEAEDLSLAQFLRRELGRLASTPTMAEIFERADRRRAAGGGVPGDVLAEVAAADRDDRR
jgi:hypothetical protein